VEKVGRNEPCPCGSGKKYKNSHQKIEDQKGGKNKARWIGLLLILFVIISVLAVYLNYESGGKGPPGPAPPGKVWSAEHGHWHDI